MTRITTVEPDGSAVPADGAPQRGARFSAGDVSIDLNEGRPFDVSYVADRDTITLHLGPMAYDVSVGGDHLEEVSATAGQLGFGPQGADVRSRRRVAGDQFVNIRAPAHLWESLESANGARCERRGLIGASSPMARQLAGMGRDFVLNGFQGGRLAAEALACLALTEVQSLCNKAAVEPKATTLSRAALKRVVEYIDANVDQDLGLGAIAGIACLSPAHFSRAFTATTGQPPSRYVMERRVHRAKILLETTSLPVAEIACRVGFSSQSHLTACFRSQIGVTPAAFRKARVS